MTQGLVWKWGSYSHEPGECYPMIIEARPLFTDRGVRYATNVRYQVGGDICFTDAEKAAIDAGTETEQSTLTTRISALEVAYSDEYKDYGFYLDDGTTPTAHAITNDQADNYSGNRILSVSFPSRLPTEYTNTRSFQCTVSSVLLDSLSNTMYAKEEIMWRGTGGEMWTYRPTYAGNLERETIFPSTPVSIVQRGILIGLTAYPTAPLPWWPSDEHEDRRRITMISPDLLGHDDFNRPLKYGIRYHYEFSQNAVTSQNPNYWG